MNIDIGGGIAHAAATDVDAHQTSEVLLSWATMALAPAVPSLPEKAKISGDAEPSRMTESGIPKEPPFAVQGRAFRCGLVVSWLCNLRRQSLPVRQRAWARPFALIDPKLSKLIAHEEAAVWEVVDRAVGCRGRAARAGYRQGEGPIH